VLALQTQVAAITQPILKSGWASYH